MMSERVSGTKVIGRVMLTWERMGPGEREKGGEGEREFERDKNGGRWERSVMQTKTTDHNNG